MRTPAWVKSGIVAGVLSGIIYSVPSAWAAEVQGSYWYALDNITKIDEGARFLFWITLPAEWHGQKAAVTGIVPEPVNISFDEQSGNQVVEWLWEPEPWEMLPEMEPRHFFFHYDFTFEETPVHNDFDAARIGQYDRGGELYLDYTAPDSWIQTGGPVRDMALQIVGQEKNPGTQAKLVYHWMLENLTFVVGGEGQRDAASTLAGRRGDSRQFATLLTALCRSLGIPARNMTLVWVEGQPHDFNEINLPGYGWFPVDASLGQMLMPQRAGMGDNEVNGFMTARNVPLGDPDYLFGNLPDHRLILTKSLNVRIDSPTLGKQVTLSGMGPADADAATSGFISEGFNSSLVHGGFHVFGGEILDDDGAHILTHQRLADSFFMEGLYESVENACGKTLGEYTDGIHTWINLGKAYMHKGQYYKAEAAFNRAIHGEMLKRTEKAEALIWCHNYLGNCYDLLGHREMALKEYGKVVDLGDNFRGAVDYAKKYLARPFRKEAQGK